MSHAIWSDKIWFIWYVKCNCFVNMYVCMKYAHFLSVRWMDNYYVVGSNLSFPTSHPGILNGAGYQMCGRYPVTPPVGQVSRVTCQPVPITARYVYMQVDRQTSPAALELCEVWVFGDKWVVSVRAPCISYSNVSKSIYNYLWQGHPTWCLLWVQSLCYDTPLPFSSFIIVTVMWRQLNVSILSMRWGTVLDIHHSLTVDI